MSRRAATAEPACPFDLPVECAHVTARAAATCVALIELGLELRRRGGGRRPLEQLLEERAVVHERDPRVLGGGLAAGARDRDRMRGTVVLDHVRMIDREIRRALLEVVDRIAALAHELLDQGVSLQDRLVRIVHETLLDRPPACGEAAAGGRPEMAHLELLTPRPLLAAVGAGLPRSRVAAVAVDSGSEGSPQPEPPHGAGRGPAGSRPSGERGDGDREPSGCSHQALTARWTLRS